MKYLIAVLALLQAALSGADESLTTARALADNTQKRLGSTLMQAMRSGGAVSAIKTCHVQAPLIAADASEKANMKISRTALRWRNPDNMPSDNERMQMRIFEEKLRSSADSQPEVYLQNENGGGLYMRAIVTQPMCLACHGQTLTKEVSNALEQYYPEDQATGFKAGDLRGAWVVSW
ncbi:MAG: DUF3365 domain-containing protein [Parahaliea sp.]